MYIPRSNNPVADAEAYYDQTEIKEEDYPVCASCGQRVTDDFWIIDNEFYCEDCAADLFKTNICTYLEDNDLF